ncbi:cation transporter [Flavobacteriaceae bacterium]|uniref:heavy-metal-associated domain-containing protein n=1 Tax=Candidatus Arcticimaribacter forsetii TaxID=2820661 RepID=UPI002076D7A9|nr:heavy-metal-associated domain-containing protein [Candidatus Arcticimaribacter forsetii]MDA8699374.1 cation transporter [Flavobacteriaceae bacterium]MDB2325874.1 cation transporter [Flavobacteriaceae bacterium]MDB4609251.1 cation transporter [Flavobacteriaceae bacterium]MDB4716969.1 cation transporter [Flavobacteriaceae bacterium]
MKKVILSVAVIIAMGLTSCKNETKKVEETTTTEVSKEIAMTDLSFGVRGNCGMCKSTIEKAANSVEGVASANWDVDKKKIDVSFDDTKTDAMAIHKAIAASGYDTEKVTGSEEAYKYLPGCCQYDHEMAMNQTGEMKSEDHSNHDH